MANLSRHRVTISGLPGLPGVATFYSLDATTMVAALHTFWTAAASFMPAATRVQVENTGDVIDEATGDIVTSWREGSVAVINGGADSLYAAPAGMVVRWATDSIVHNHRLRGRTFIVPLLGAAYFLGGTVANSVQVSMRDAADALVADQSSTFVVWSRPFAGRAAVGTKKAIPARAGSHGLITGTGVDGKVSVLRSRRD